MITGMDEFAREIAAAYRLAHCVRCREQMAVRRGVPAVLCEECQEDDTSGRDSGDGPEPGPLTTVG